MLVLLFKNFMSPLCRVVNSFAGHPHSQSGMAPVFFFFFFKEPTKKRRKPTFCNRARDEIKRFPRHGANGKQSEKNKQLVNVASVTSLRRAEQGNSLSTHQIAATYFQNIFLLIDILIHLFATSFKRTVTFPNKWCAASHWMYVYGSRAKRFFLSFFSNDGIGIAGCWRVCCLLRSRLLYRLIHLWIYVYTKINKSTECLY